MMYNILWIDDDHEKMLGFKGRAKMANISLNSFKSKESGMNELRKNYLNYDGVLLDAKFLENDSDLGGSEDTEFVHRTRDEIRDLPKKFEIFVLTGQAEVFNSSEFKKSFKNVYAKGSDESIENLFADLKVAADCQQDTQLRHKFPEVFKILDDKYLGNKHSDTLLDIVKSVSNDELTGLNEDFNALRKVLESLFDRLAELNILPKDVVGSPGWINGSGKFIAGKHPQYDITDPSFIHPMIQESLKNLLYIVQDASHNEGQLRLQCDDFCRRQKTGYLYKSTVYAFFDILVYFRGLMEKNLDAENNGKKWKKIEDNEWVEGYVSEIQGNGWGKFTSKDLKVILNIPNYKVRDHGLQLHDPIKITIKANGKNHINQIEKHF